MLIRKISIRLNDQNTFWNLYIDIIFQVFVANNFRFLLYLNIASSVSSLKMAPPKKRSPCSMTVMLLRIMKSLNISSAVCCLSGKSSWSILFWNTISSKAPIKLNTGSVIRTQKILLQKIVNDLLHAVLMGTRKRIHQWFLISPPSSSSTSTT